MLPHMSQEDGEKSRDIIEELEEMMSYADAKKIVVDQEKLRKKARKKLHEVLGFMSKR